MGTKERREREREERRQAILQAARTIAGEEGWQAVTIRRVADSVEHDLDLFAQAESRDNGKPVALAREVDIPRAVANLRFFASAASIASFVSAHCVSV